MRKKLLTFLVVLLIVCIACQPTPDNEVIVNKGDKKAEEVIFHSKEGEVMAFVCPDAWKEEGEVHKTMTLHVDAQIETGEGDRHPVYTIRRRKLDEQTVEDVIHAVFPDADASRVEEQSYEELLAELEAIQKGVFEGYDEEGNEIRTPYEDESDRMEEIRNKMEKTPTESTFVELNADSIVFEDGYTHLTLHRQNESLCYVSAINNYGGWLWCHTGADCNIQKENWVQQGDAIEGEAPHTLENVTISQKEAEQYALALFERLGMTHMQLSTAVKARCVNGSEVTSEGWQLEYGPATEGTHGCSMRYYSACTAFARLEPAVAADWKSESIELYVTENGVESFSWSNMYSIVNTANENVQLLPFEEIQKRIRDAMRAGFSWTENSNTGNNEVYITKIILTTGIMQIANNQEEALLVPAWAIFYTTDGDMKDYIDQSLLLLNALDGSIMN